MSCHPSRPEETWEKFSAQYGVFTLPREFVRRYAISVDMFLAFWGKVFVVFVASGVPVVPRDGVLAALAKGLSVFNPPRLPFTALGMG
jgi:hypothetical protein